MDNGHYWRNGTPPKTLTAVEDMGINVTCPDICGGIRTDLGNGTVTVTPGTGFWLKSNSFSTVKEHGNASCGIRNGTVRIMRDSTSTRSR